jgi:hypothetical protein
MCLLADRGNYYPQVHLIASIMMPYSGSPRAMPVNVCRSAASGCRPALLRQHLKHRTLSASEAFTATSRRSPVDNGQPEADIGLHED